MPAYANRKRLRLQTRLLVSFVVLVTSVVTLVLLVVDFRQRQVMVELNREKGLSIGRSLAAASSSSLLSYNYVTLQQMTERAAQEDGVQYVIVLDKEGHVAGFSGHSDWQGRELDDEVSRTAVASSATLVQEVQADSTGRRGLDIAVPVFVEGSSRKWGMVRVGLSLDAMYAELNRTRVWILVLGLGVLLLAGVVARIIARRIVDPLHRLVEATGELARGNFDYRVNLTTGDEIEDLSRKFDLMAREIRQKQSEVESTNHELADLNANLEATVEERTVELREAEEKYRLLVEQSPNPICIIQDDRLVFFNEAFTQTLGYSAEELTSPEFEVSKLIDPSQHEIIQQFMSLDRSEDDDPANTPLEIQALHRNGSRIYLDTRSTVIAYKGRPALEAILVDVTEQRDLQDRVVSYERLRALGEMASGVAHDFNNVLGAILARAQFLQKQNPAPEVSRGLRIIEKAAQDGGETVKRIQEFTRVRTDRDFAAVSLNTVLDDVIEMTRSRWEDEAHRLGKNIRMVRNMSEVEPVEGNISELREVFTNLILNAVDAIPTEGDITVSTHGEAGQVVVTVMDSGEGMSAEVQRRLFDPFFTTKGASGNGLGMSIVYGIVRRHGGDIEVVSELNEGTVFRVSLPAVAVEAVEPETPVEESALEVGTGRVLVVDDDEDIRELVTDILRDVGYDVEAASDGAEAILKVGETLYDLVVTDLGMPGVSGWDVARETRAAQPDVRILLLTGWGATLDQDEVERNGIDRTLKKPFEMNELLRVIQDLLTGTPLRKSA